MSLKWHIQLGEEQLPVFTTLFGSLEESQLRGSCMELSRACLEICHGDFRFGSKLSPLEVLFSARSSVPRHRDG